MIRDDKEYWHSASKLPKLRNELRELSGSGYPTERGEMALTVIGALNSPIEDIEREIAGYENLKEGQLP